jgi:hypothetical protein
LEELVKDRLSILLYFEMAYDVLVIDTKGRPGIVRIYAYCSDALRSRRQLIGSCVSRKQRQIMVSAEEVTPSKTVGFHLTLTLKVTLSLPFENFPNTLARSP